MHDLQTIIRINKDTAEKETSTKRAIIKDWLSHVSKEAQSPNIKEAGKRLLTWLS